MIPNPSVDVRPAVDQHWLEHARKCATSSNSGGKIARINLSCLKSQHVVSCSAAVNFRKRYLQFNEIKYHTRMESLDPQTSWHLKEGHFLFLFEITDPSANRQFLQCPKNCSALGIELGPSSCLASTLQTILFEILLKQVISIQPPAARIPPTSAPAEDPLICETLSNRNSFSDLLKWDKMGSSSNAWRIPDI